MTGEQKPGGLEGDASGVERGESAGDMLSRLGMDGKLWAEEFQKTALTLGYPEMDDGWLLGWFCNAIMAGYDHARRKYDPEILAHFRPQPSGETRGLGWLDVKDAPQDGSEILLNHRTHGIIQGWFSKGEWSDDTPNGPREYSGDMWILGDDLFQDEVEYGENQEVIPSGVTGWLPLDALFRPAPVASSDQPEQGGGMEVDPNDWSVPENLDRLYRERENWKTTDPVSVFTARLHPKTTELVNSFAIALAHKLLAAEEKYRYSDGWLTDDWEAKCRADLLAHVHKGDPLDVAAYAAFCWARGWSTTPAEPAEARVRELTEHVEYLRRSRDGHAAQAHAEFEKRVRATEALERIDDMRPATCETGLAHDMAQIASEALAALQQAGEVG